MRKSQWTKAKETLKNLMLEYIQEFEKDIKDYSTLRTAVLNGNQDFKELSESGEYYYWTQDLAKLFCTPRQYEQILTKKHLPQTFKGKTWLLMQAFALCECMVDIAIERGYKITSNVPTITTKKGNY